MQMKPYHLAEQRLVDPQYSLNDLTNQESATNVMLIFGLTSLVLQATFS